MDDLFATMALVSRGTLTEEEIKKVLHSVFGTVPKLHSIKEASQIIKIVDAHRPFLPEDNSVIIVAKGSIEISMNNIGDFVPLTRLEKINGDKKARFIVSYKFMPFVYRAAENGAVLIIIPDIYDFLGRTTNVDPDTLKKIVRVLVDSRI